MLYFYLGIREALKCSLAAVWVDDLQANLTIA
jgi:hypothetical protein